jgi:hypothetical protein
MISTCERAKEVWICLGILSKREKIAVIDRSGSVIVEEIIKRNEREKIAVIGISGGKGNRSSWGEAEIT